MGAEFRLVILTNCDKLPKAMSEPLVEYFANPSPTTVCLVVATTLAKNTRLYKAIKKLGDKAIIDCAPKKTWEMPPQVVKMAAAHGKAMAFPPPRRWLRARERTPGCLTTSSRSSRPWSQGPR